MRAFATCTLAAYLMTGCAPTPPTVAVIYPEPLPQQPSASPARLPPVVPVVPRVDLEMEEGLPVPANAACMSAVGEQAGDFNVRVLGNEPVAEGTEVTIGVGEQLTRWRCVANPSGEVVVVGETGAPT